MSAARSLRPEPSMNRRSWTPPAEVAEYRIVGPLGSGSDRAYLGFDQLLDRDVTVRFAGDAAHGRERTERFLADAKIAARLQHPNVVAIYRAGEIDGRPYLVSEHALGSTLAEMVRPMPWADAHKIGVGLARGLAAAHRKGVLHRDVRPANLLVTEDGTAKVLALGVAELANAPWTEYHAPEVWRGETPSRRSDVYSLGAVLYELCSGQPPYGDVPLARLRQLLEERDARPLAQVAPEVSPRLAEIVDRCLRREPADRFASAEELREALEQVTRAATHVVSAEGNPYRGLRPFEAEHRALFFGRTAEIEALLERLRADGFVLVAGDSGVGKSSICRAGILPRVADGALQDGRTWSIVQMVPGRRPLAALAAALAAPLRVSADDLARELAEDPASLVAHVRRRLGGAEGLLVFVDQLEELHTNSDPAEARVVDDLLMRIAVGVAGVRVVATVRADFLTRVATLPRLGDEIGRALFLLRPLTPEKMRDVVVGPAESSGVRFESDAMVGELVDATAHTDGGLPLLQFALALLWEARDERGVITKAALTSMGGVGGALARHADAVVDALSPSQRTSVRRVMMRLVTLENTRARRSEIELTGGEAVAREALDALVGGRLVVAHEADDGSAYELAHEVLVNGWGTLGRWLHEDAAWRRARERLAQAAAEWERLHRGAEGLWSARQLAEVASVQWSGLRPAEDAFLEASRRAVARGRRARWAAIACVPLLALAAWGGIEWKAHRYLDRQIGAHVANARTLLEGARTAGQERARKRLEAFDLIDGQARADGEASYARALAAEAELGQKLRAAAQSLEAAVVLDPSRAEVKSLICDVLYERAALAEEQHDDARREELLERLKLYDEGGAHMAKWNAPATLDITTTPAATISIARYEEQPDRRLVLGPASDLGASPLVKHATPPGSYVVTASAPGRAPLVFPVLLSRGEKLQLSLAMPAAASIPRGFVYVAPGRFLFGSASDEDMRKGFFDTAPLHRMTTGAFLVAETEVTFADWIVYLRDLPASERAQRLPSAASSVAGTGSIKLEEQADGLYRLTIQPGTVAHSAREGEHLRYDARSKRVEQDWQRFPVMGISGEDATAYAAWLRATNRVPGARLCSEVEWERATRGADGRQFPHGGALAPDDADFDLTYGKSPIEMGPDEVGSHPSSRSPFGLEDTAGNAYEWTTSALTRGELVVRGGSFYYDTKTAKAENRQTTVASLRDASVGLRLCADAPAL